MSDSCRSIRDEGALFQVAPVFHDASPACVSGMVFGAVRRGLARFVKGWREPI